MSGSSSAFCRGRKLIGVPTIRPAALREKASRIAAYLDLADQEVTGRGGA